MFGPPAGKEFIIFVDDVNMPMKEVYGAQPPIEILRQWFDSGGWYDRKALEMRKIVDVIFVCACGPPGGGRNHVTARFYRHFNIITYVDISNESLMLIYSTILKNFLIPFDESVQKHALGLVDATVKIFNVIVNELRPTPAKPHYVFNMRDVSKVFQGILMCDRRRVQTPTAIGRLWYHEISRVFGDRLVNDDDLHWMRSLTESKLQECTGLTKDDLWSVKPAVLYGDFVSHFICFICSLC